MRLLLLVSLGFVLLAQVALAAGPAAAQNAYEPKRGSAERAAIMDAVRPVAASHVGAPVEFVVEDLKVFGDRAYAALKMQRPGGKAIDMAGTPNARKYGYDPNEYPGIYALLLRRGGGWTVASEMFSPFEPPFGGPKDCSAWRSVLPVAWCQ
ncbi:hypothetical protein HDIA_1622 [Hartmannibacter diazotrophicus]|uniref:DUF4864 domain-containing protein n=1 Tax=Hartmannibacter diazotrophicus TaxID=1482074 RepID=A0A2C9D4L5_9HYPH|nr:hypothetical protein [Hartmannibacter diazotrophicus]SON55163.1 hypothetical protein HDIA_1622 [Hartmannibacter diazotrophicus]